MKLKQIVSVAVASLLSVGSIVGLGTLANATELKIPNDTVKIGVVADGTHNGPGTETFVNSANGYNPGDDTVDDGVVASGDFVIYKVTLTLAAGPARDISVAFSNQSPDDLINLSDFRNLNFDSALIKSSWDDSSKTMNLSIPRGMAGTLSGTVIAQAKDSLGKVSTGHKVEAVLTNKDYTFKSVSKAITVVSAPLADLTISGAHSYGSSQGGKGSFKITPFKLTPEGYSSAGVSSEANWITDINVSEFPDGTTWSIDGTNIPVVDGKLKGVSYSGTKYLDYTIGSLPQKGDPARTYKIWLEVSPDSFSVDGGLKNVADPGNGQDASYDTASYGYGATKGKDYPNNNYSRATWYYQEVPEGRIYGYYRYAPSKHDQTIYEEGNIHWANATEWADNPSRYLDGTTTEGNKVTSDNDIKNESYVILKNVGQGKHLSDITITDTLDTADGNEYQKHSYDPTKQVVVKLGSEVLSPSKYKVEWLVGDEWVESDSVVSNAKTSRVTFPGMSDYALTDSSPTMSVYFPVKALGSYDPFADDTKLLQSRGDFAISDGRTASWVRNIPLSFPKVPTVSTFINVNKPATLDGTGYTTEFKATNNVMTPPMSGPYTMTSTLTLHDVYDASTFKLVDAAGWEVQSISGKTVTLTKTGNIQDNGTDTWSAGNYTFTVNTIVNPNNGEDFIDAPVSEVLDVAWGAFGPLPASSATSKSSVSQPIGTSNAVYSALKSIDKKVEIKDTVSWESTISVGKLPSGESWSQDILLPSNGDVSNMRLVNSVNGTHISIDPTTGRDTSGTFDGIGRSKFNGSYTLDSMKFSAFAPDTQVTFYNLLPSGAKVNPVTRTVNSDGTVDLTGLGNKKAMTITSGQNLSDLQSAGAKLTFTIKPQDNLKDDVYVAWMGNTTAPAGTVVSWPDDSTTVSSTVSGYVFEDANASHVKDKDESPFSGVSVQLQEKVGDNWTPVADYAGKSYSVKTNSDGYYEFVNLKSGTYRVVLPNVERESGTNVVASINGATGVDAKDGDLPQAFTNRFDVTKPTVQTVSYRQFDKLSSSNPEVRVAKDSTLENVNFGYLLEKSDLTLDKSPATVTNSLYDSTVKWTVDITNTGKTPIDGAKLFDRTSKEVVGFQGSISYKKIENEITGTPVAVTGSTQSHGFAVATTDGYWLVKSDGSTIKAQGITGNLVALAGEYPDNYGFAVATTDGCWMVDPFAETYPIYRITGTPVALGGDFPTLRGFGVATTDGYWFVKSDSNAIKAQGITGTPVSVTGDNLHYATRSFGAATTDGYWLVKSDGSTIKAQGITGTPVVVPGNHSTGYDSSGVVTTEGYWLVESDGSTIKAHGITGTPVAASDNTVATTDGFWRVNPGGSTIKYTNITGTPVAASENIVATTDGYWFITYNSNVIKLQGITGTPVSATDYRVATTDGYWLVKSDGSTIKAQGITGTPVYVSNKRFVNWSSSSAIATTEGFWYVNPDDITNRIGEKTTFYDAQGMTPVSTTTETASDGRGWINREYDLPTLLPGETVTATFTGSVSRDHEDFVVANQSWVTSPNTPREGIETHSHISVTGDGMPKGVPDIPLIPTPADLKVKGVDTVKTSSINTPKDVRKVDDLSDQTPALIPRNITQPQELTGSISGTAWYDTNKDGLRTDDEPRVPGMKVVVRGPAGAIAGETVTASDGTWLVDRLPVGVEYTVQYEALGWTVDGQTYTVTTQGTDPAEPNNSDADYSGLVVKPVITNPTSSGYADLGLVTIDGSITLTKGAINNNGDANAEVDVVKGENSLTADAPTLDDTLSADSIKSFDTATGRIADTDNNSATQAYSFRVANNGSEPVGFVKITDQTTAGLDALMGKTLVYKTMDGSTTSSVIGADGYVKKSGVDASSTSTDDNLIMEPGSQLLGYFHVGFAEGKEVHSNEMTVVASVVDANNNPVKDLKSKDQFTAKYELVKAKLLKVEKVDGSNTATTLSGASFKVESTSNNSLDDAEANERIVEEVGTFRTDSTGAFNMTLKAGIYKITETSTPFGYLKPNGAWYIQLSYDGNGNPQMSVRAVGNNPYGDAQADTTNATWGTAQLRNDPMFNIPSTGGYALWFILGSLTLLGAGVIARKKVLSNK